MRCLSAFWKKHDRCKCRMDASQMQREISHPGRCLKSPRFLEQSPPTPTCHATLPWRSLKRPSTSWKSGKAPERDNIVIRHSPKRNDNYIRSLRRVSEDPNSRRPGAVLPSSLVCVPFKTLEKLIHSRIDSSTASSETSGLPPWYIN